MNTRSSAAAPMGSDDPMELLRLKKKLTRVRAAIMRQNDSMHELAVINQNNSLLKDSYQALQAQHQALREKCKYYEEKSKKRRVERDEAKGWCNAYKTRLAEDQQKIADLTLELERLRQYARAGPGPVRRPIADMQARRLNRTRSVRWPDDAEVITISDSDETEDEMPPLEPPVGPVSVSMPGLD